MIPVNVGDIWRVRLGGLIEGDRQIVAKHASTVEVSAPPDLRIDVYRWNEIEFLSLLRRSNGKPMLVMP